MIVLMSRATLYHKTDNIVYGIKFQLLSTPFLRRNTFPLHLDSSWICWKYHMYWPINRASQKISCVRTLLLGLGVQIHSHFSSRLLIDSHHELCRFYSDTHWFEWSAFAVNGTDIPNANPILRFISHMSLKNLTKNVIFLKNRTVESQIKLRGNSMFHSGRL